MKIIWCISRPLANWTPLLISKGVMPKSSVMALRYRISACHVHITDVATEPATGLSYLRTSPAQELTVNFPKDFLRFWPNLTWLNGVWTLLIKSPSRRKNVFLLQNPHMWNLLGHLCNKFAVFLKRHDHLHFLMCWVWKSQNCGLNSYMIITAWNRVLRGALTVS